MDDNVMRTYATKSTEARHYLQYDQGQCSYVSVCMFVSGCMNVSMCDCDRQTDIHTVRSVDP